MLRPEARSFSEYLILTETSVQAVQMSPQKQKVESGTRKRSSIIRRFIIMRCIIPGLRHALRHLNSTFLFTRLLPHRLRLSYSPPPLTILLLLRLPSIPLHRPRIPHRSGERERQGLPRCREAQQGKDIFRHRQAGLVLERVLAGVLAWMTPRCTPHRQVRTLRLRMLLVLLQHHDYAQQQTRIGEEE